MTTSDTQAYPLSKGESPGVETQLTAPEGPAKLPPRSSRAMGGVDNVVGVPFETKDLDDSTRSTRSRGRI